MWLDFVGWLRAFDAGRAHAAQCGFYGLDMYSLHASMARVLAWLERHRPEVAPLARERYACFDRFGDDSQVYGMMTGLRGAEGCEEEVVAMLVDVQRAAAQERTGPLDAEAAFDAEQNARLVRNAESYYRRMYMRNVSPVEPARYAHGRDARCARSAPRPQRPRRRSSSGRTTPTSATRVPPRWGSAAAN
jgi:erythromycin esterase-like protein